MNRLIGIAINKGWREGILRGSRPWLIIGGAALAIRVLQRAAEREQVIVYRQDLPVGEAVTIANEVP
jgi:hypothetical protein